MVYRAWVVAVLGVGLLAVPAVAEDAKKGPRGNPLENPALKEKILKKFDANGDGQLSDEEKEKAKAAFRERVGGKGGPGGPGGPGREELMKKFDANGNGQLEPEEKAKLMAAMKERFGGEGGKPPIDKEAILKKFDANGDGQLSGEEKEKARAAFRERFGKEPPGKGEAGKDAGKRPGGPPNREEILKKFDANGDGQLSDEEKAKAREAFKGKKPE